MPRLTIAARPLIVLATAALATACTTADMPEQRIGSATLTTATGMPAGTAQLYSRGDGLSVGILATGLTPGAHGFHLHTAGRCDAPDFTSAGGHLNPSGNTHGSLSPGGKHLGDLPNLVANASGSAAGTFEIDAPRDAALAAIFDNDGTAVVIHAGADDYRSDPAGDAGSRIACGIMRRVD